MVRTKTPAKSSRDLYFPSQSHSSLCTRSGQQSTSSSGEDSRLEQNQLYASQSQSNRKCIPRKSTPKSKTKVLVQKTTAVFNKSGRKKRIKYKVLKDIKFLQSTVHNLIPKLPFSRVVKEILLKDRTSDVTYIASSALAAIQEAAEIYLTCLFADCNLLAFHAKRVTVKPIDMALVLNLRENR